MTLLRMSDRMFLTGSREKYIPSPTFFCHNKKASGEEEWNVEQGEVEDGEVKVEKVEKLEMEEMEVNWKWQKGNSDQLVQVQWDVS